MVYDLSEGTNFTFVFLTCKKTVFQSQQGLIFWGLIGCVLKYFLIPTLQKSVDSGSKCKTFQILE